MQNRRNFVRNSLLAMTGAGISIKTFSTEGPGVPAEGGQRKFVHRTLGGTGIKLPVVSMGTGNCDNPNLIREALDQGVKLLATHQYYLNGNNEKMVGEVLKGRPRDSCMILTGTGEGLEIDFKNGRFGPKTDVNVFMESVNRCLERLQVDYVDILNAPYAGSREAVFFEPVLNAMGTLKKQGKARFIGIASHNIEHETLRDAADTGVYDMVTIAYNFRKTNLPEMEEALQHAADKGLGIIAMKTMAGVYWDKDKKQPINTKAALKWALQNENIHTSIPDCSTFNELHQDLDIMADMALTEDEIRDLHPPTGDTATGLYCQQCRKCLGQCPGELDIPTMMRSYMYTYGYRNLALARHTLDRVVPEVLLCENCHECRVDCEMGFDVRGKLMDVTRIRDIPEDLIHSA